MQFQESAGVSSRPFHGLIASDKVEGTPVYRTSGERIGRIERVMIDKLSGVVAYAVMSFGGVLGASDGYYPIPWSMLTYNVALGGYEIAVSQDQFDDAPQFGAGESWEYGNREQEDQLYRYYNTPPYWA